MIGRIKFANPQPIGKVLIDGNTIIKILSHIGSTVRHTSKKSMKTYAVYEVSVNKIKGRLPIKKKKRK